MGRLKVLASRVAPAAQACAATPPKVVDPYYLTPEWKALRAARLRYDGGMCTVPGCGREARVVDHRVSRRAGGADAIENLRSLCVAHDNLYKEDHLGRRRGGG